MKKKLLLYLDGWFLHFGIANKLQHQYELYGIVDFPPKPEKFFHSQNIVKFKKLFFYNDYSKLENKDRNYLSSLESKYGFSLNKIIAAERIFQKYNDYHRFTESEILSIISRECQFFEEVLEKVSPDVFLMFMPISHQSYLIEKMCQGKNIECLITSPPQFANRLMISHNSQRFDKKVTKKIHDPTFLEKYDPYKQIKNYQNFGFKQNTLLRYKPLIEFLLTNNKSDRYENLGKTKKSVLQAKLKRTLNRKQITKFFDKNLSKNIPLTPFAYFPLHYEPEKMLLIDSPYFTDQLTVIENIAKSLPIQYVLCVKEHPVMETLGWRKKEYYERLLNLPNVVLLHPKTNPKEIMEKSSIVISISGTSCMEAAFLNTPSICFTRLLFSDLPCVTTLESVDQLPSAFANAVKKQISTEDLANFIGASLENSFKFDHIKFTSDFAYELGLKGVTMNKNLDEKKIQNFLEKHEDEFIKLTEEHLKLIQSSII